MAWLWRVAFVVAFGVPAAALATPSDAAEVCVQRGIAFRKASRDLDALEQFQKADQIASTPRTKAQIGVAEQALGRWLEAEVHLGEALAAVDDPWILRNRGALDQARVVVRSHLGTVEVVGSPPNAIVRIDGRDAGTLGSSKRQRAHAGSVVIDVRAPGHFPVTRTITIGGGGLTRETIVLQPIAVGSETAARLDDTDRTRGKETTGPTEGSLPASAHVGEDIRWKRRAAWGLAGAAAGFGIGGIVAFAKREDYADDYNRAVDTTGCTGASAVTCSQLRSKVDRAQYVGIGGVSLMGALALSSALLFWFNPAPEKPAPQVSLHRSAQSPGFNLVLEVPF